MPAASMINQLSLLVISGKQAGDLMQELTRNDFYYTIIDNTGSMLQEPVVCLLVGLSNTRMDVLEQLVRIYCQPQKEYIPAQVNIPPGLPSFQMIEAQMGGAIVYTLEVERFEQF